MLNTLSTPDEGKNTVNTSLTVPAPRKTVENKEFAAFTRRIIRAHAKRVASGDVEALTDLVALATLLDEAIGDAVEGLREFGYSWAEIARPLGLSKQAAQQRWGTASASIANRPAGQQDCPSCKGDGRRWYQGRGNDDYFRSDCDSCSGTGRAGESS